MASLSADGHRRIDDRASERLAGDRYVTRQRVDNEPLPRLRSVGSKSPSSYRSDRCAQLCSAVVGDWACRERMLRCRGIVAFESRSAVSGTLR